MKLTLVGLIAILYSSMFSQKSVTCDREICGKVEGQVYDAETQNPINEVFDVIFYFPITDQSKMHERMYYEAYSFSSDKNGYFLFDVPAGDYFIRFTPHSLISKYCFDPLPVLNPENRKLIKVVKNRVTYFKKTAKLGGQIHITLVDRNSIMIKPGELFNAYDFIDASLSSKKVDWNISGYSESMNNLANGEITIYRLFPEVYDVSVEFRNVGYGNQRARNVFVESGKTTEVNIIVNVDDKTGIYGKVSDENGTALVGASVIVNSIDPIVFLEYDCGEIETDEFGKFKIVGMKPNKYQIQVYYGMGEIERCYKGEIEIISDQLTLKNIVLNENSNCEKYDDRI